MDTDKFHLVFLPLFEEDVNRVADYISLTLGNPDAAARLADDVLNAIHERLRYPTSFEPWKSKKERDLDYFRIYVRSYTVFYVVHDNVMEVRRFVYTPGNWKKKMVPMKSGRVT